MPESGPAILVLEDGLSFRGPACGAKGERVGELVFNTAMTGYQEILTDPSYRGQTVVMTYPHIGNYGIAPKTTRAAGPSSRRSSSRDMCHRPSNYRSRESLLEYLTRRGVVAIEGIDTRALTRRIRDGVVKAIVLDDRHGRALAPREGAPRAEPRRRRPRELGDLREVLRMERRIRALGRYDPNETPRQTISGHRLRLRGETQHSARPRRDRLRRDGGPRAHDGGRGPRDPSRRVFLSNGPGDPAAVSHAFPTISRARRQADRDIWDLPRPPDPRPRLRRDDPQDALRPPRREPPGPGSSTGKIEITSQNHSYEVVADRCAELGGDAPQSQRQLHRRDAPSRAPRLLGAVPPGGVARPAGFPIFVWRFRETIEKNQS